MMEMYQKAYECYRSACQSFGMDSVNIYQFVKQLTKEQLEEFLKQAIN